MGIYERVTKSKPIRWANGGQTWWELSDPGFGQTRRRLVVAGPWEYDPRTTCYCCSCPDPEVSWPVDPHCRNHGWDGTRPCEVHGLPGVPGELGTMPISVQSARGDEGQPAEQDHDAGQEQRPAELQGAEPALALDQPHAGHDQ